MSDHTPIDQAHAAMEAAPTDDALRMRFYERLADGELFLLLSQEATGDQLSPEMFDVADGRYVLAFDRPDRLSAFAQDAAPYAALSGRVLAQMLAGQGVGLGLNLDVAPSSILIPAPAMAWLAETVAKSPDAVEARIKTVFPPAGLPDHLIESLDTKLATAIGRARSAYLVGVEYDGGGRGHMLGFVDAAPDAQGALAHAVGEALTFSGIEAGALDVGFFAASDATAARLATVGLRFDLPQPKAPTERKAPGSDPNAPPILRS
ncbi:MAG: SseB family protein [Sedimentitalea sp.]